jgi:flagellar protein FlgJ
MTQIVDHNAAAMLQLPATLPPRLDSAGTAGKLGRAREMDSVFGTQPVLPMAGQGKSPEELKEKFTQFVGETFYGQMIKAMRSTVGKPAYFYGGRGEDVFQGQLDQQLAQHLTEATAETFAKPLFNHQFPHLAEHSANNDLNQLSQLRLR